MQINFVLDMVSIIAYNSNMKLSVTYAKSSYKDKTYYTPLVQYAYRDAKGTPRHKTVLSLAEMPDYVVKVIAEALKRGDASVLQDYAPKSSFKYNHSVSLGAAFAALGVLTQIGATELLRSLLSKAHFTALSAFIVERITREKPLSIFALRRQFNNSPIYFLLGSPSNPDLNTWYNSLGALEGVREQMLVDLYLRNASANRVFLYDITSSYFEGDKCPLAEFGYNRDGKRGKKQAVIGVICDAEGRPVWIDVYKGNTADQTTVKEQLLNLRDKLGVKEFIFVGDRGMLTRARIRELEDAGWWESFGYISALTRGEILGLIDDEKHPLQPDLFDYQDLAEIEHGGERFVLCHNPNRKCEDMQTRERLLEKTEEKLESLAKNVADGRLRNKDKSARRLYRWINRWGMARFFTYKYAEGFFEYARNMEEIERFSAIDGCYVIRARAGDSLSKEELRDQYKDLKQVEQAFRTLKTTDINVRPIRVRNEEHVRGYIFGCFLAYRATWEIRKSLAPVLERDEMKRCEAGSLQEVYRSLENISAGIFEIDGETRVELSDISKLNKKYLKLLKLPPILKAIN